MIEPNPDDMAPLEIARDLLKQARIVLEDELAERPNPETEAVINDLTMLLVQVKAIGHDGIWGSD